MTKKQKTPKAEIVIPDKSDLFLQEYLSNGFNGTQAALKVFDIDPNCKNPENAAAAIASEYLRKPHVQQKLASVINSAEAGMPFVVKQLMRLAQADARYGDVALGAADRLAKISGQEITDTSSKPLSGNAMQVILNVPPPPAS